MLKGKKPVTIKCMRWQLVFLLRILVFSSSLPNIGSSSLLSTFSSKTPCVFFKCCPIAYVPLKTRSQPHSFTIHKTCSTSLPSLHSKYNKSFYVFNILHSESLYFIKTSILLTLFVELLKLGGVLPYPRRVATTRSYFACHDSNVRWPLLLHDRFLIWISIFILIP